MREGGPRGRARAQRCPRCCCERPQKVPAALGVPRASGSFTGSICAFVSRVAAVFCFCAGRPRRRKPASVSALASSAGAGAGGGPLAAAAALASSLPPIEELECVQLGEFAHLSDADLERAAAGDAREQKRGKEEEEDEVDVGGLGGLLGAAQAVARPERSWAKGGADAAANVAGDEPRPLLVRLAELQRAEDVWWHDAIGGKEASKGMAFEASPALASHVSEVGRTLRRISALLSELSSESIELPDPFDGLGERRRPKGSGAPWKGVGAALVEEVHREEEEKEEGGRGRGGGLVGDSHGGGDGSETRADVSGLDVAAACAPAGASTAGASSASPGPAFPGFASLVPVLLAAASYAPRAPAAIARARVLGAAFPPAPWRVGEAAQAAVEVLGQLCRVSRLASMRQKWELRNDPSSSSNALLSPAALVPFSSALPAPSPGVPLEVVCACLAEAAFDAAGPILRAKTAHERDAEASLRLYEGPDAPKRLAAAAEPLFWLLGAAQGGRATADDRGASAGGSHPLSPSASARSLLLGPLSLARSRAAVEDAALDPDDRIAALALLAVAGLRAPDWLRRIGSTHTSKTEAAFPSFSPSPPPSSSCAATGSPLPPSVPLAAALPSAAHAIAQLWRLAADGLQGGLGTAPERWDAAAAAAEAAAGWLDGLRDAAWALAGAPSGAAFPSPASLPTPWGEGASPGCAFSAAALEELATAAPLAPDSATWARALGRGAERAGEAAAPVLAAAAGALLHLANPGDDLSASGASGTAFPDPADGERLRIAATDALAALCRAAAARLPPRAGRLWEGLERVRRAAQERGDAGALAAAERAKRIVWNACDDRTRKELA